jgi:hypothetical protein
MANNFQVNVYQFNQNVYTRDNPVKFGFPTTGVIIQDVSGSPTRSLSSGYNVYSMIRIPSPGAANSFGDEYYVAETFAQLAVLVG